MDNTPEYIEMCQKAVEIQELWEPKAGDWTKYGVIVSLYDNRIATEDAPLTHYSHFITTWLPRQDQLQGMVDLEQYNHLVIRYDNRSDNRWSIYFRKSHTSDYVELYAIGKEQLWLAFVMHEKYGKKWDGKDWKHN